MEYFTTKKNYWNVVELKRMKHSRIGIKIDETLSLTFKCRRLFPPHIISNLPAYKHFIYPLIPFIESCHIRKCKNYSVEIMDSADRHRATPKCYLITHSVAFLVWTNSVNKFWQMLNQIKKICKSIFTSAKSFLQFGQRYLLILRNTSSFYPP